MICGHASSPPPILSNYHHNWQCVLHCDASLTGLGAVLLQINPADQKPVVISYASRSLLPSERHYPICELEVLAVCWSLGKSCEYLYMKRFKCITDSTYVCSFLRQKQPKNLRRARWLALLLDHQIQLIYSSGATHHLADMCSRLTFDELTETQKQAQQTRLTSELNIIFPSDHRRTLRDAQRTDSLLGPKMRKLDHTPDPTGKLVLIDGLLYLRDFKGRLRLWVPSSKVP